MYKAIGILLILTPALWLAWQMLLSVTSFR
jgi:hypothetical protein